MKEDKHMKTIITILAVCTALCASPEITDGQVEGGSLFVTDGFGLACNSNGGSSVVEYTAGTQPGPSPTPSIFAGNLNDPRGLVFDSAGNFFVASNNGDDNCNTQGTIFKISSDGVMSTFATFGVNRWLSELAIDSAGDLFVGGGDNINNSLPSTIYKI